MPKGSINWESVETWQRLVASIFASGAKLNLKDVAKYYGTTYDTLENKLRKTKKDAMTLQDEVASGQRGDVTSSRAKSSAPSTPRKTKVSTTSARKGVALDVTNGRVEKTPRKTPSKKPAGSIKQEDFQMCDFSGMDGVDGTEVDGEMPIGSIEFDFDF